MTLTDLTMNAVEGLCSRAEKARAFLPTTAPNEAKGLSTDADKAGCGLPDASPNDGKGLSLTADKAAQFVPDPSPKAAKGFTPCADKAALPLPDAAPVAEMGHPRPADKATFGVPVSALIDQLAELQVRRKFWIGNVNKQTNAVRALVRRGLGWRYDDDEGAREKINARSARIVSAALAGKDQKPEDEAIFGALSADLAAVYASIAPCAAARHEIELEMKRTVRKLPVYPWSKEVKGLGELGLAVIIAEAGDLSNYPKKGHLWKRLGLAPLDGRAYSTWRMKGGLKADDWVEAGYSPRRRAEIYAVVSEPLFRANSVAAGPYRAIYDRRRETTATTNPDWTKAHSHMDGLRIMTKHLIRDLWNVWRQESGQ